MISSEECFAVWAPDGARWTEWAKPVVFSRELGLPDDVPVPPASLDVAGVPERWAQTAVVVDLPGADSVSVALALASRGFRPVPLYNGTVGPNPVIDVQPLVDALGAGASELRKAALPPDAPPAFLLDANRTMPIGADEPGRYDNRWVVLPQDFPSAARLRSVGLQSATLIQRGTLTPAEDLAHVLRRWQEGGLSMTIVDLSTGRVEQNATIPAPSAFRLAWYAAVALLGLRRGNAGGFGALVPQNTGGRSGFYG